MHTDLALNISRSHIAWHPALGSLCVCVYCLQRATTSASAQPRTSLALPTPLLPLLSPYVFLRSGSPSCTNRMRCRTGNATLISVGTDLGERHRRVLPRASASVSCDRKITVRATVASQRQTYTPTIHLERLSGVRRRASIDVRLYSETSKRKASAQPEAPGATGMAK